MGLSTRHLERAMDLLFRTTHPNQQFADQRKIRFLGVFAFDEFPLSELLILANNGVSSCCIVNIEPRLCPGKHWVAFFMPELRSNGRLEFFDSYAKTPSFYGFSLPPHLALCTIHNAYCLQSDSSAVCGHYCVVFLCLRAVRHAQFLSSYPKQSRQNAPSVYFFRICIYLYHLGKTKQTRDNQVQRLFKKMTLSRPFLVSPTTLLSPSTQRTIQSCRSLIPSSYTSNE